MAFRKFAGDKIFDGYRLLQDHVLIVAPDGKIEAVVPGFDAGDGIEKLNGILTPGFINCHCHLELSHMKGKIPERTGLVDFVFKVVTERSATDETIAQAIADAEQEMKENGIVAVGDICNNASTLSQKQKAALHYYNFIEASGWLPSVSEGRFERAKALLEAFIWQSANENLQVQQRPNNKPQNPNCSIVPHAPYSVSNELWERIQPYFKNKVVSIHNQEAACEDEFFRQGTGDFKRMYQLMKIDNTHHLPSNKSSLQSYYNKLTGAEKIILVHNTFSKQEDIDFTNSQLSIAGDNRKQSQTFFCLCVNANQYIEGTMPPVDLFRKNNCKLVLGTDSLASNRSLNMLDEIKTILRHFPNVPLEEILGWVTINGASALGFDDQLGSFEKGKKPGVVLFSDHDFQVKKLSF